MLSEKITEKLAEVLVDRIEELNTTILEEVGNSIKEIGKLTPSQAYKLIEDIKFGGSYNKIIKKLAEITNMNEKDILKILKEVAIQDQNFAKQFYEYRKKDFIPYEKNIALQNQVKAIAKLTQNTYKNLMNTSAMVLDDKYVSLGNIYQKALDRAVISIAQGKDTYQTQMRKIIKEMADKGIRTRTDREGNNTYVKVVDYKSGTSRRLDSAVRMSIMDGMRTLSNEIQKQFGEEFGADGIEISVHEHPAEDHEDIQGHQYSNEEFEKLNNSLERPISTLNCYHYVFSIVLGVSKPEYTQKQLNKIKKDNKTGFSFEGKHYTLYEGTQLQRQIETKIRTLKDRQIGLKALGDYEEVGNCQRQITQLTHKYNDLCKASGLKPKKQRMSVSGYRKIKVKENSDKTSYKFNNSYDSLEKATEIFNYSKYNDPEIQMNEFVKDFYNKIGYGEKPEKLNKKEFNKIASDTKYGIIERGYRGNNVEEYIKQFKDGDLYIGEQKAFGSGTYFGYGKEAHSIAKRYGEYKDSNVLKAILSKDAKVITAEDLHKLSNKYSDISFKKANEISKIKGNKEAGLYYNKMNKIISIDDGIFASALGYDAIDVSDAHYLVILNRGKVVINE